MFHNMPQPMLDRMAYMEAIDVRDRVDGTPLAKRLRQVPPETGKFLALLAAGAPQGDLLEIGSSGGYSTMWLSRACQERSARLTTFEILPNKEAFAKETLRISGAEAYVDFVLGDAREFLPDYSRVAFCFMDAEKDLYLECYEIVVPNLVRGGLFVADNVISHASELGPFLERALSDARVDALEVPIGKGVLVCRKI